MKVDICELDKNLPIAYTGGVRCGFIIYIFIFKCAKSHLLAISESDDCLVGWMRFDVNLDEIVHRLKDGNTASWWWVQPVNNTVPCC